MESEFVESVQEVGTVRFVSSPEFSTVQEFLSELPVGMGDALMAWAARVTLMGGEAKVLLPASRVRSLRDVYMKGELLFDAEVNGFVGGVLVRPVGSRYEVSTHT